MIIEAIPKISIVSLTSIQETRKSLVVTQEAPWKMVHNDIDLKNKLLFVEDMVNEDYLENSAGVLCNRNCLWYRWRSSD